MKKIISVLLTLTIIFGLLVFAAVPASAEHVCEATDYYQSDDTGHWNPCLNDDTYTEKLNYQKHDTSVYQKYCEVCKQRIDHVCYNPEATCQNGGRCIYCPYGAPENTNNHNTYGTKIDDKNHKVVCDCGYVKVASEPHVLNSWDDIDGQPGMEDSWCEVCFHAVARKKQSGSGGGSANSGNNNNSVSNNNGNTGNNGNNSGNKENNESSDIQSSVPDSDLNGAIQPEPSLQEDTNDTQNTDSNLSQNNGNTDGKDGSLLWLWILLIILIVGGATTAVVIVVKKKKL